MKYLILVFLFISNFCFSQSTKIDENTIVYSKSTGKAKQVNVWNYFQITKFVFVINSPDNESKIVVNMENNTIRFDKGVPIKMSIYQKIDINQYVITFNEKNYSGSLIVNYQNKNCDLYLNHILTFQ